MTSEVVVNRYKPEDLDELLDMIKASFSTRELRTIYEKEAIDFWLSEYTEQEIKKIAKTKHLYVARLNGKIVGSGIVGSDNDMAYFSGVFVDPNIQGKGIGRKLIDTLEKDEICLKHKKIYLTAAMSAVKFYLKLGYTYKYDVPEIILDGNLDCVYMEKDLS